YENNHFTHYQKADTTYTPELFGLISHLTTAERRVAAIVHPGNNVNTTDSFNLTAPTDLLVIGMGEISSAENDDHGWIEDESGKIIWDMDFSNTMSDGNGRIRAGVVNLNAGSYRVRYRSEQHYSYGHWSRAAPLHPDLWGIQVARISPHEVEIFDKEAAKRSYNGLGDKFVSCITEDSKKNIWIGSFDGGVEKFNPATRKFISFANRSNGPLVVICIMEDKKTGNFWVGDYAYGLLSMSPKGEILKTYNAS